MLTSLTPSSATAFSATDTFSKCWCWLVGFLAQPISFLLWSASTNAHSLVPSAKSRDKSDTLNPVWRSCSLTQLVKVWVCMVTQEVSCPLMGIPLAACPSGLRASSPTWEIAIINHSVSRHLLRRHRPGLFPYQFRPTPDESGQPPPASSTHGFQVRNVLKDIEVNTNRQNPVSFLLRRCVIVWSRPMTNAENIPNLLI